MQIVWLLQHCHQPVWEDPENLEYQDLIDGVFSTPRRALDYARGEYEDLSAAHLIHPRGDLQCERMDKDGERRWITVTAEILDYTWWDVMRDSIEQQGRPD